VLHAERAHVAERHRLAGRVLGSHLGQLPPRFGIDNGSAAATAVLAINNIRAIRVIVAHLAGSSQVRILPTRDFGF